MSISTVFLLLIIYSFGILWAAVLPKASLVEGTRWAHLAPIIKFINPGPFGLKEVRRVFYRLGIPLISPLSMLWLPL